MYYLYLFKVKGFALSHKDVFRIDCEQPLKRRIKLMKRMVREKPAALSI